MVYQVMSVWDIIKRFLIGWTAGLGILVVVSCVKHWDYITAAFTENTLAFFNAVMPLVLIVYVLFYLIRSVFR